MEDRSLLFGKRHRRSGGMVDMWKAMLICELGNKGRKSEHMDWKPSEWVNNTVIGTVDTDV